MPVQKKNLFIGLAIAALVAGGAAVAAYVNYADEPQTASAPASPASYEPAAGGPVASAQPALPPCDDGNIVGTIAGGAVGGLLGNQVGKGDGKTAATIGGAVGGAVVGNKVIPTRNVTCR